MIEPMECIRVERNGLVMVVTIDHPDSELNVVDARLHHELCQLMRLLRDERTARCVVLTGQGNAFSAGGDMSWFPALRSVEALAELRRDARSMIWDFLDAQVPVVCALNGHALGLGASIALLSDVIVASREARIGDPHVRVGLVAGDGGTVIWPLAIGPALAKEALLTGEPLTATRAAELGLINHVVAPDDVLPTALDLAQRIAANPPLAVQLTKVAVNRQVKAAMSASFDEAVALESQTFLSADHAEAVAAFLERRPGRYEGR